MYRITRSACPTCDDITRHAREKCMGAVRRPDGQIERCDCRREKCQRIQRREVKILT